jgi:choline dehydrogenase-like flavoprotein
VGEHWIIVGAGSAGCVLANRLSKDPGRRVTLLDDGPGLSPGRVPAGIAGSSFFAAMTEPGRVHPDLLATRVAGSEPTLYQRGRGIGGSSAVNAMVALRGNEGLYQSWGWLDLDAAWARVALPRVAAQPQELGPVDRALLRADPRAEQLQLTRSKGARVTSAEAYLWPVLDRPNLDVRPDAEVDVVLFNRRRATGVRLSDSTEIAADRVVMAAGAIHSPTILLRSGVDTPEVGRGLQDHPSAVFTLRLRDGVTQDLTALPIASALHATIGDNLIQLLPMNNLGPTPDAAGLGALLAALMTPVGRAGTVTIDGDGKPVIDFALLDDARDLRALTDAVDLALEILDRPSFSEIVAEAFIDGVGTTTQALTDDEAIARWLHASCGDYVHATSTCAMGTVVDDTGAVNGYDALFVCDASIFPSIPDANTHIPTTMVAERFCLRHARPGKDYR